MALLIQVLIAGIMLLAWVWLLGRPGLATDTQGNDLDAEADGGPGDAEFWGKDSKWRRMMANTSAVVLRTWDESAAKRRRQLMLATMIAAFVSFFLAIALKGRFVYLFVMMLTLLGAHLVVASRVGARVVEERRRKLAFAAQEKARLEASPQDLQLGRAGTVTLLGPEDEAETVGVTSYVSDLISEAWAEVDEPSAPPAATTTSASESDLAAQLEWADDTQGAPARADSGQPAAPPEKPVKAKKTKTRSKAKSKSKSTANRMKSTSERIFTRAAKDAPANPRSRRKPQPIHIESDLDDEPDLAATHARAVNQN